MSPSIPCSQGTSLYTVTIMLREVPRSDVDCGPEPCQCFMPYCCVNAD